jgi:hypothetical protein
VTPLIAGPGLAEHRAGIRAEPPTPFQKMVLSHRGALIRIQTADPVVPRAVALAASRDLERVRLNHLAKPPHERYPAAA